MIEKKKNQNVKKAEHVVLNKLWLFLHLPNLGWDMLVSDTPCPWQK